MVFLYLLIKNQEFKAMTKTILKLGVPILLLALFIGSCSGSKKAIEIGEEEKVVFQEQEKDTIEISHAESNYEIIIIEPGFQTWLQSIARPEGYYSQSFMENRNELYVL